MENNITKISMADMVKIYQYYEKATAGRGAEIGTFEEWLYSSPNYHLSCEGYYFCELGFDYVLDLLEKEERQEPMQVVRKFLFVLPEGGPDIFTLTHDEDRPADTGVITAHIGRPGELAYSMGNMETLKGKPDLYDLLKIAAILLKLGDTDPDLNPVVYELK